MADAIENSEEIFHALSGLEANVALTEFGPGQNLGLEVIGLQFILIAEEETFTDSDLAAGTNQTLPVVGIGGELAGQKNFDAAVQKITGGRIATTERLSASAFAAAIEPGGKNTGIVEDDEIAGLQQVGEFTK